MFLDRFFANNYSHVNTEYILTCLRQYKMLPQIKYFAKAIYSPCKDYRLCKMVDFQHGLISGTFGFFSSGFLHRITPMRIQNRF